MIEQEMIEQEMIEQEVIVVNSFKKLRNVAKQPLPIEEVKVEIDGSVYLFYVKGLGELDKGRYESRSMNKKNNLQASARRDLIAMTVCNEHGELLVEKQREQSHFLNQLDGRIGDALFKKAMLLSGYTEKEINELTEVF